MHQKLIPDPFSILVNNPNSTCMQGILLQLDILKEILYKALKKLTLFFF